jgi:periplasmic protein TonB
MAYADTRPRPSPTSMGAAIAVNALFIAGVILAAPHITSDVADGPLVISTYAAPTPPDNSVRIKKPSVEGQSVKRQMVTRPEIINEKIESGNVLHETGTIDLPPLGPIGPVGEIVVEPPITRSFFKDATINPRFRDALQPDYPPELIRQEVEGAVTIRVLIGTDGRVKAVEPIRFAHSELLQVTQQHALRKWRFLPATRDGVAVESWREMSVRFEIPE